MRLDQTVDMLDPADWVGRTVRTVPHAVLCDAERYPVLFIIGKLLHDLRLYGNIVITVLLRLQITDKQSLSHPDLRRNFALPLTDLPYVKRNVDKGAAFALFDLFFKRVLHKLYHTLL